MLLSYAISWGVELEYQSRLGLHALPKAKPFYERFGMQTFGLDASKENLTYFEMTSEQASGIADAFMNEMSDGC